MIKLTNKYLLKLCRSKRNNRTFKCLLRRLILEANITFTDTATTAFPPRSLKPFIPFFFFEKIQIVQIAD